MAHHSAASFSGDSRNFQYFSVYERVADVLFGMLWAPVRKMLLSIWQYLPNVFTILVIVIVMKYIIRFVRYIFREIESGKLKIKGLPPSSRERRLLAMLCPL